jgi:hypothetical protein
LPAVDRQELAANPAGRPEHESDRPQQEFAFDFRDSRFDPGALEISGNSLGTYAFPETAGLRMSFPPGAAKPLGVGVGPSFGLRGDFDILAQFEGLSITPPAEAWGAGIEVDALFNSPYDHRAQFELRSYPGDRRVVSTALHDLHVDRTGAYQKDDFHTVPQAGTLWLARRQGVLRYALATGSSSDFQLLSERYVGRDDVDSAQARVVSSDAVGGAAVVWKSLVVRADEFLFDARTQPAPLNQLSVDLSRESLGGFLMQVPEPGSFNFVQRTRAGVWMRTPPGQTNLFGVRAATNAVRLEGDFEVTAEFELAQLAAPESGWGAGVQLRLDLGDPEQHMLHLCRRAYPDGRQGLAVHNVWQAGDARQDDAVIVPASDMAGRMRIVRRGERVTWSFSPAGSNQFEELKSADVGRAPVQAISLVCESSHPATGTVDVTWKSLSIRAGRIWR